MLAKGGIGTIYVSSGGDGTVATNWSTALTDVQTALDLAREGDTLYVKGETFSPSSTAGFESRYLWQSKSLTIRGSYEGSGTPGASDPVTWPTVLTQPGGGTNRILYVSDVTNGTLAGVTITGGQIIGGGQQAWRRDVYGGGVYIADATNLTFDAVTVATNRLTFSQQKKEWGGGVYALNSYGVFTNCTFRKNRLPRHYMDYAYGGGLHLDGGQWELRNSRIEETSAAGKPVLFTSSSVVTGSKPMASSSCRCWGSIGGSAVVSVDLSGTTTGGPAPARPISGASSSSTCSAVSTSFAPSRISA